VLILPEDRSASPGPVGLCGSIDRADLCGDPAYPQFRWQCAVFVAIWSFCWWRSWWKRSVPCWEPSKRIILVSNSSTTIFIARWSTAFWGLWSISEYIPEYIMIFLARIIIFYNQGKYIHFLDFVWVQSSKSFWRRVLNYFDARLNIPELIFHHAKFRGCNSHFIKALNKYKAALDNRMRMSGSVSEATTISRVEDAGTERWCLVLDDYHYHWPHF